MICDVHWHHSLEHHQHSREKKAFKIFKRCSIHRSSTSLCNSPIVLFYPNMPSKGTPTLDRNALLYMFLLALQFGMQPMLTRKFTPKEICRSTVIMMQELLKLILAFSMLTISGSRESAFAGELLSLSVRSTSILSIS